MKHLQLTQKEFNNFRNLVYNKLLYSYEVIKNTISVSFEDNTMNNNLIEELGY